MSNTEKLKKLASDRKVWRHESDDDDDDDDDDDEEEEEEEEEDDDEDDDDGDGETGEDSTTSLNVCVQSNLSNMCPWRSVEGLALKVAGLHMILEGIYFSQEARKIVK